MGMKVYLSGDNIIVEKTATATLTIPRSRAKFTFISVEDNDPNAVTTFSNVEISDIIIFSNVRNDTLGNIQYQGGGTVGTYEDIIKYFSTFFLLGEGTQKKNDLTISGTVTVTGGATAANQVLEIDAIENQTLKGTADNGDILPVPVTQEGHLQIAIHEPLLPFGSVHVENLIPIFQADAVYGINDGQVLNTKSGTGNVTAADSLFSCTTGTTIYSFATMQSRKRLRYRAGQGIVGRFTAVYSTPVANSYQIAGYGTASDGLYFGYGDTNNLSNTSFGILYVRGGVREIRTLTVTTGATVNGTVQITLNGVLFTPSVTNAANIQRTVYEISRGSYAGWEAYPSGATVIFIKSSAGATAGAYSFAANGTGSAATIALTKAGAASVDTFISQSNWNGDKLDGTGASGVTLDPTKGNVFQIEIQYLGFGGMVFKVEATPANSNNKTWITVHSIKTANSVAVPIFTNPSFPFAATVYSAGSTTNLMLNVGSFAGFVEGTKMLHGGRFTYFNQLTTVGAANFQALFTFMNTRVYNGRANQAVINLLSVMGAVKHTSPVVYYLIKNGVLAGNPNFVTLSSISCSSWDTAATTVTYSNAEQLIWTGHLGDTGELDHHFGNGSYNAEEVTLQPGEWITLAAKSTTGTPAYVTGSINTREDQ